MIGSLTSRTSVISRGPLGLLRFAGFKEVHFEEDSRRAILKGINLLADSVAVTLGPGGRHVALKNGFQQARLTKDGYSIAEEVEMQNPLQNLGAQLLRNVSSLSNQRAGDGTTTAVVLSRAIMNEGQKGINSGVNPMDLRTGINIGADLVIDYLASISQSIQTPSEIAQVATVSSNNDQELGAIIGHLFHKVGRDGVITVEDGRRLHHEVDFFEGLKVDSGFMHSGMITNQQESSCELEEALILLANLKVNTVTEIMQFLDEAMTKKVPLLIFCEDMDAEILATLIQNKKNGSLRFCVVKAPGFGEARKNLLEDIAILTGARVLDSDVRLTFANAKKEVLGRAKKLKITKNDSTIIGGYGNPVMVARRVAQMKTLASVSDADAWLIRKVAESDFEREQYLRREAKLKGGVGIIRVGGASEAQIFETKDRIIDAIHATRCALEEGVVPGNVDF